MNQEQYLINAIEDAKGTFLTTYIDYHRGLEGLIEDAPTYGAVIGAVRVYGRVSNDYTGKLEERLWQDAKDLLDYLIEQKLF